MDSDLMMWSVIAASVLGYLAAGLLVGYWIDRLLGEGDGRHVHMGILWPPFVLAAVVAAPFLFLARLPQGRGYRGGAGTPPPRPEGPGASWNGGPTP